MICPNCNSEVASQAGTCPYCHTVLPNSVQGTPPAYPQQTQYPTPPPGAPPYSPPGQPVGQYPPPYYPPIQYAQPSSVPMGLGIASIILIIFMPLIGLGCGIAGLLIYNGDCKKGLNPPSNYKILNIIGIVLNGLLVLASIVFIVFFFFLFTGLTYGIMDAMVFHL